MAGPFPTRVTGPFVGQVDGFRAELGRLGYSRRSAEGHLYVLAHLSRWLEEEELVADTLTAEVLERFVASSRGGPATSALGDVPSAPRRLPLRERGGPAGTFGAHLFTRAAPRGVPALLEC